MSSFSLSHSLALAVVRALTECVDLVVSQNEAPETLAPHREGREQSEAILSQVNLGVVVVPTLVVGCGWGSVHSRDGWE